MKFSLLYNVIYFHVGDVGKLGPIFSFVLEAPLFQNRTSFDYNSCKCWRQPFLWHKGPELRAVFDFKFFKRDEGLETH